MQDSPTPNRRLYVGNLSYDANVVQITQLFARHGEVTNVNILREKESQRPRGFAFVDMRNVESASAAKATLHGTEFLGRQLCVDYAKERQRPTGNTQ